MLADCLRSVKGNLQDLNFETFVVDNGSTDGSARMVGEDFPEVTLIANQRNEGFRKSQ